METYNAILERMRSEYAKGAGSVPEDAADIGIRLRVLAGEVYRLQAGIEWLRRQAFPQTAGGAQLDLHGAQRGVERRGSTKATGVISFSRYIPIDFDIVIPKGTVCASYGEQAVEYETTEDAAITAGQVTVDVPAQAVVGGSGGNAAASYINTLISEVTGVNYVVNAAPFTGGADPEGDEDYRERVLAAYSKIVRPGNAVWYEEQALAHEGITQAQAVPRENGAGTVSVYVWGDGEAPDEATMEGLSAELNAQSQVDVEVTVKAATTKKVTVVGTLKICPGGVFTQARSVALEAIRGYLAKKRIGDPVYLADLERAMLAAEPSIIQITFNSSMKELAATPGVLPIAGNMMLSEAQ